MLYVGGAVTVACQVGLQFALLAILGADRFGVIAVVTTTAQMVVMFVGVPSSELALVLLGADAIEGRLGERAGNLTSASFAVEAAFACLSCLTTLGAVSVLTFTAETDIQISAAMPAALLALAWTVNRGTANAVIRATGRYGWLALASPLTACLRLAVAVAAAGIWRSTLSTLFALAIGEIVTAIVLLVLVQRACAIEGIRIRSDRSSLLIVLAEVPGYWLGSTVKSLQTLSVYPLAALHLPSDAVAYVRIVLEVASIPSRLASPLNAVVLPRMSLAQSDSDALRRGIRTASIVFGAIAGLSFIVLGLAITGVGPRFIAADLPEAPAPILGLLVLAFCVDSGLLWLRNVVRIVGRVLANAVSTSVVLVLYLVAMTGWLFPVSLDSTLTSLAVALILNNAISAVHAHRGFRATYVSD